MTLIYFVLSELVSSDCRDLRTTLTVCRICPGIEQCSRGEYSHSYHQTMFLHIFQGPLVEHIYNTLLALYAKYTDVGLKGRILQCLGTCYLLST